MASVPRREANLIPLTTGYVKLAFALENTFKDAYLGSKNLIGSLDLKKNFISEVFFKFYVSSTLLEEQVPSE